MMSSVAASQTVRQGPRWQISLGGCMVLVLAVGLSAGIVLRAHDVWGDRPLNVVTPYTPSAPMVTRIEPVPLQRTAGLALEVAAAFLVVCLLRDVLAPIGNRRSMRPNRERSCPGLVVVWRLAAIGVLCWFISQESTVLALDYASEVELTGLRPGWGITYRARQNVLPICGVLAVLGLALAMGGGSFIEEPAGRRSRPWWLFASLAGLVAVLLASQPYFSTITHLVLVAMEAVANAHRLDLGPALAARLIQVVPGALIALAVLISLALVVARDFERARRREPLALRWPGCAVRVLLLGAALGLGVYHALVTVPFINPWLGQGFALTLSARQAFAVLAGFTIFAAGLAARAVGGGPPRDRPRWLTGLSFVLRSAVVVLILGSIWTSSPASAELEPVVPGWVAHGVDALEQCHAWLWGRVNDEVVTTVRAWFEPERLLWTLMLCAVALFVVELTVRPPSLSETPLDRAFASRVSTVRFGWLAVALTGLCLTSLPVLLVAGRVIFCLKLRVFA